MMRFQFFILLILLAGCGTNPDKPYSDTPTSGKVQMAADETLLPLIKAQVDTFHGLYRYAKINMIYNKIMTNSPCNIDSRHPAGFLRLVNNTCYHR